MPTIDSHLSFEPLMPFPTFSPAARCRGVHTCMDCLQCSRRVTRHATRRLSRSRSRSPITGNTAHLEAECVPHMPFACTAQVWASLLPPPAPLFRLLSSIPAPARSYSTTNQGTHLRAHTFGRFLPTVCGVDAWRASVLSFFGVLRPQINLPLRGSTCTRQRHERTHG